MSEDNVLELEFPAGFDAKQAQATVVELKKITAVTDGDIIRHAGIDPTTVKAWIEVAVVALPLVTSVITLIRNRGLKGVKLKLTSGAQIEIDEATPAEIEALIN